MSKVDDFRKIVSAGIVVTIIGYEITHELLTEGAQFDRATIMLPVYASPTLEHIPTELQVSSIDYEKPVVTDTSSHSFISHRLD